MGWLIQERPKATIQNNQNAYRIINNTLDRHVFAAKPTTIIQPCSSSTTQHF